MIRKEVLQKILDSFSGQEEFFQFATDMNTMINEILFSGQLAYRNLENEDYVRLMVLKQFFILGLFVKENIEVLHEMINAIDFKEITHKEKNRLEKDKIIDDLDRLE